MEFIKSIIDLGPEVMMPIIFFILALICGVKVGKAFKSGMLVGIGFVGINLVVGALLDSLGPATQDMVARFGLNFSVVDVGWPVGATIGWGSPIVPFVVFGALLVNILLLVINKTKTVNIDIFNYWHLLLVGGVVYAITGNMLFSTICCLVIYVIVLFIADKTAPKIQEAYDLKGVSFAHATSAPFVPVGMFVNFIISKIPGIKNIDINPEIINKKFGVLGEPLTLGTILGVLLGILAGWEVNAIAGLAVKVAAVMVLLPAMVDVLVEGLLIVRNAAEVVLKKRFPNREFYIGLDTALLIGEPSILATSLLLIPASLVLAIVLPGNKMLPFVDLASLVFLIAMISPYCKKNMFRIFVSGLVIVTIVLYAGTYIAPFYTAAANASNVAMPAGVSGTEMANMVGGVTTPLGWFAAWIAKMFAGIM